MSKNALSLDLRNSIVWLERQPGVTSVVQGRYTRTRHKHKPGFARITENGKRAIRVQIFDAKGTKDLFVYADPSPQRDRWVSTLAGGDVIVGVVGRDNGGGSAALRAAAARPAAPPSPPMTSTLYIPTPVDREAGQLFDVTPELAAKWLERNTRNRALRQDVVMRYASDMKAGRWMQTGDAIAFDTNGVIVNGQHRLWAVLEAGVTIQMLVTFDLNPDVVKVLDDHLKRKLTDVAHIANPGMSVSSKHAGIARMLMVTNISLVATDKRAAVARISRQAQLSFMDKHMPAIDFAIKEVFRSSNRRGLTVVSVLSPVARAYYTQDRDRLRKFGEIVMSGMPQDAADDSAALVLRNLLMRMEENAMRAATETIYRKTERALFAFLKCEKIKTLYEAPTELFPLPEERAVKPRKS